MAVGSTTPRSSAGDRAPEAYGPPSPFASFRFPPARHRWVLRDRTLDVGRPTVMGILNITPDSFSDGGELVVLDAALERARQMVDAGADILDVGGESTRPGAAEVPVAEEIGRILPVIERLAERFDVPVSVDTRKAAVARAAVRAGAVIVNDVSGSRHDPSMASTLAELGVGVVLMHMRGTPSDMATLTDYEDVAGDVIHELRESVAAARSAGITEDRIVIDPGLGFAKTAAQSLTLLRESHRIVALGYPVLVGPSRKSFLGEVLGTPAADRLEGTLAACAEAYVRGARIFRVHDVREVVRFLELMEAVETSR